MLVIIPNGFQNHYTIGFANGIASNGIKVNIISSDNIDEKKFIKNVQSYNLRGSVSQQRNATEKAINYIEYYLKLLMFIFMNKRSILHLSGGFKYTITEGVLIQVLMKLLSKRLILTVHNLIPHDSETKRQKMIYKIIYRIPDCLIVHTLKMKTMLISQFNVSPEKISIMEHGINDVAPIEVRKKETCRKELNIPSDRTVFLFFGYIAPYKGLDVLLEAFEKLDKRCYLIVAGQSKSRNYEKKIVSMLSQNKNGKNILYKNKFIPDEEISLYFNAADGMILPYKHIDQSGVVFLAWRFGLPIIAFDVGSLSDYVDGESGIIIKNRSPESLTDALNDFVETKTKYSMDAIREKADKFTWNEVVKAILPLYEY